MTFYQTKLTEEDLKKIDKEGIYSMFPDSKTMGRGILDATVIQIGDDTYLRYREGSSCDSSN